MQLHSLRSNPVIKFFAYCGFGLIIISFVFFYGWDQSSARGDGLGDPDMARYNSTAPLSFLPWRKFETIKASEMRSAMGIVDNRKLGFVPRELLQYLLQNRGDIPHWGTDIEAVQYVMDERVLYAEAQRLGINVPESEVLSALTQQYGSNPEALDQHLEREGKTMDQFIAELQRQQAALQARDFIRRRARVSLYELWQEYAMINEKITLELAAYPAEALAEKMQVTDAELQARLDAHPDDYRVPDKRRYGYVKVSTEDLRSKLQPTREQLQEYYDKNTTLFAKKEAVRVEEIFAPVSDEQPTTRALALITMAQDLSTSSGLWGDVTAKLESENPGSTLYHRPGQWIERTDEYRNIYGPDYFDRVFSLAADGISTPVQSTTGFHILRRLEGRGEGTPSLDEVYAEVENKYRDATAETDFRAIFDKQREDVRRYNSIHDYAKDTGYEDKLTTTVEASTFFIPEIGNLAEHSTYLRNLKSEQLSELIPIPASAPTAFAAIQIVEEFPGYLPKLDEVRAEVEKAVRLEKAVEEARVTAQTVREKIVAGATLETASANAPKGIVTTDPFTRVQPVNTLGAPLLDFQKQTLRIGEGSSGVSPYGQSGDKIEGFAVWRVKKIEPPTQADFARDRHSFERDYISIMGEALVEEWLADKRRELGYELLFTPKS